METVDLLLIFGAILLFINIFIVLFGNDFKFNINLPVLEYGTISLTSIFIGLAFFFFILALTLDITKTQSIAYIGIFLFLGGCYLGIKILLILKKGKNKDIKELSEYIGRDVIVSVVSASIIKVKIGSEEFIANVKKGKVKKGDTTSVVSVSDGCLNIKGTVGNNSFIISEESEPVLLFNKVFKKIQKKMKFSRND